jgi:hypothetical protein
MAMARSGSKNGVRFTYPDSVVSVLADVPDAGSRSAGSYLDHRAKVVAAVGALLLQVGADGDQVHFVQCLASKARYVLLRSLSVTPSTV